MVNRDTAAEAALDFPKAMAQAAKARLGSQLERMIIRDLATLFSNTRGIESLDILGFRLANDKIEK